MAEIDYQICRTEIDWLSKSEEAVLVSTWLGSWYIVLEKATNTGQCLSRKISVWNCCNNETVCEIYRHFVRNVNFLMKHKKISQCAHLSLSASNLLAAFYIWRSSQDISIPGYKTVIERLITRDTSSDRGWPTVVSFFCPRIWVLQSSSCSLLFVDSSLTTVSCVPRKA